MTLPSWNKYNLDMIYYFIVCYWFLCAYIFMNLASIFISEIELFNVFLSGFGIDAILSKMYLKASFFSVFWTSVNSKVRIWSVKIYRIFLWNLCLMGFLKKFSSYFLYCSILISLGFLPQSKIILISCPL